MNHPQVTSLYKYRAFNEYSLQMLINEIAWFATPNSFNDPFDCGILIDERRMAESIQQAVVDAYAEAGKDIKDSPPNDLEIRPENKEAFYSFRNSIYELIQRAGIFSLSETNDDILMWAHYADSHKGFCIEYARLPDNILGQQAEPVAYQEDIPSLAALDVTSKGAGISQLVLTKSCHWKYEKEWRVFSADGGKALQFPCKIKSIIFGLNMSEQNRYTIQRILENRNVLYREAIRNETQFSLEISDL